VRKLKVIERGLAAGPALAAKPNKYAHVQGKLEVTHSKVTRQYQSMIEELRAQLVTNQKETFRLENEARRIRTMTGGDKGGAGLANLKGNIQDMYAQIRQATVEMETLQGSFVKNEFIFKESKNYIGELQTTIRQVSGENEKLKHANSMLHIESQQVLNLQIELEHVLDERDKIEQSLRNVAAEPFLKPEMG
jgi:chromosome segregation ATPase